MKHEILIPALLLIAATSNAQDAIPVTLGGGFLQGLPELGILPYPAPALPNAIGPGSARNWRISADMGATLIGGLATVPAQSSHLPPKSLFAPTIPNTDSEETRFLPFVRLTVSFQF